MRRTAGINTHNPRLSLRRRLGPLLKEERRLRREERRLDKKVTSIWKELTSLNGKEFQAFYLWLDAKYPKHSENLVKEEEEALRRRAKEATRKAREKMGEWNETVKKADDVGLAKINAEKRIREAEDSFWKSLY